MRRANILLVDNDVESIRLIREFLEKEGYSIFTKSDPIEARHLIDSGTIDLAILDLRLLNDEDDKDVSGLTLAKETKSHIPKIVLTRFPTFQAVREALGPTLDGLPPAVGFVAKQEGLEAILRSVKLALLSLHPLLESNLLEAFETPDTMTLPIRLKEFGIDEASRRLQQSLDNTSAEITKYREQENKRASQFHVAGLIAATLGLVLILSSVALILLAKLTATFLPMTMSAIIEAIGALFFIREDAAYKRVNKYFQQLNELNQIGNLLVICDSLESSSDRQAYKKKVINHIIGKWLT